MKVHIMSFLFTQFGSIDYSEQEIDRCIGILKVNGMKLDHGKLRQNPGVVLYPIYCLINSDCVSNTNYIKTEANLELQARTHSSFVRVCINQCNVLPGVRRCGPRLPSRLARRSPRATSPPPSATAGGASTSGGARVHCSSSILILKHFELLP